MANKTNSSKNFFENMLETQQQVMDTLVENTKKLTNGNTLINETIDKGTQITKQSGWERERPIHVEWRVTKSIHFRASCSCI